MLFVRGADCLPVGLVIREGILMVLIFCQVVKWFLLAAHICRITLHPLQMCVMCIYTLHVDAQTIYCSSLLLNLSCTVDKH